MRVTRGQGFDPRLGLLDYSGYERAAAIEAQSMQQLGQNIGEAIKGYKANKQLDKKMDQFSKYLADKAKEGKTDYLNMIGVSDEQIKELSGDNLNKAILEGLNNYGKSESVIMWDSIQGQKIKDSFKKSPMEKKEEKIREVVNDPEKRAIIQSVEKYENLTPEQLVNQLFIESEYGDALETEGFDLSVLEGNGDSDEDDDEDSVDIDMTKPNFFDRIKGNLNFNLSEGLDLNPFN
jgi:hypothetical protein|tara:strand:- start:1 stop:705 length:705 start_codon:yes stop_codon:yes gene_type:complete